MSIEYQLVAFSLVNLFISFLCGLWAYGDAKKRNSSGIIWFLVVFCLPFPLGLAIWLFGRPKLQQVRHSLDPDSDLKMRANRGRL